MGNNELNSSYAENAPFWVKIIREHLDRYRLELTNKAVLDAIGPANGLTILDAGCGEGYLSRILTRQGARVIGVDVCSDLIRSAQELAYDSNLPIEHFTASVNDLPIPDNQCDVIVCNHLLNDIQDISGPFREFARVSRDGGRLVILMLHPCFYDLGAERAALTGFPLPQKYFQLRTLKQNFKVAGITSPAEVTMWFRPLEDYVSKLSEAGYSLISLREPHPSPEQLDKEPWWSENFVRPLFMLIVAKKNSAQKGA